MNDEFDQITRTTIYKHMEHNHISKIADVWFNNLKWLVLTDISIIAKEYNKIGLNPFNTITYKGNICGTELTDFGMLTCFYHMSLWEAEKDSEFIITDISFGCFEKGLMNYHYFFVLSPKRMIVLTHPAYGKFSGTKKSWFHDFIRKTPQSDYYTVTFLPKKYVYIVNGIALDCCNNYMSYYDDLCLYRSVLYYEKYKLHMFENNKEYSLLKKKVFQRLKKKYM
jgi:hypothetical protein